VEILELAESSVNLPETVGPDEKSNPAEKKEK
jgi:hypothetical protein